LRRQRHPFRRSALLRRLWPWPASASLLSVTVFLVLASAGAGLGWALQGPRTDAEGSLASPADIAGAPASAGGTLAFAVKGDWGSGAPEQAAVTDAMCRWREVNGFEYVLTTGDNFYWPDGGATLDNYYRPEACLRSGEGVRWRAAWGNHDYDGTSTADVLGAPSNPKYYAWQEGEAAFFVYDGTNVTEAQRAWLRNAVCSSAAPVKIIYGHQPPFSNARYGPNADVERMVHPVARECDVALVLGGHEHLYLRSNPIEGVTYVITGGGGAHLYDCGEPAPWVATCLSRFHFLYLEVDSEAVRLRAVGTDGSVLDAVTIRR
jgi:hypothetical protein